MELSIPLADFDCLSKVTVTRQNTYRAGIGKRPTVLVSSSQNWFVVSDDFQIIVCSLEAADQYNIKGALFFRLDEYGHSTLCLLNYDGSVDDFSDTVDPSIPLQSPTSNVHIGAGGEIVSAAFLASDGVVLFSVNGSIGFVWLDTKEFICTGYFRHCGELKNICCGSMCADSLAVVLTCEGFFGVINVADSTVLAMSTEPIPSDAGVLKSFVPVQGTTGDTVNVISTFSVSGEIRIFVLPTKQDERPPVERKTVLQWDLKSSSFLAANSYVKKFEYYSLVFSVWCDRVQLSMLKNADCTTLAVVENDMNIPYVTGCWIGGNSSKGENDVFVVTRADSMAVPFSIAFDEGQQIDVCRMIPQKHIVLRSSTSTLLRGHTDYYLLLTVNSLESLWNNDMGALSITDSQDHTRSLFSDREIPKETETLFMDIVPFRNSITLLSIKRSGKCVAVVPLGSQWETILLAEESKSESVASCLLYERRHLIFVTGHEDGSINVWVSGKLECAIRMLHTGVIDKILLLSRGSEELECGFISMCTLRGTVAIHHSETFQCTRILTSPGAPLSHLVWDPWTEYMFAISGSRGNLWHVPTCHLERTFDAALLQSSLGHERQDLLEPFSTIGPIKIDRIVTGGATHFSLVIDVLALLKAMDSVAIRGDMHSACKLALSIVLSGTSLMNSDLLSQHGVPEQPLGENHLKRCVVCAGQSATYTIAVILLTSVLKTSSGVSYAVSPEEICTISQTLVDSKRIEALPKPEMIIMQSLPLLLQLPNSLRGVVRIFVATAVKQLTSSKLKAFLEDLSFLLSEEIYVRRWFGVKSPLNNFGLWCYGLFARVALIAEVEESDGVAASIIAVIKDGASPILGALQDSEYRCNIHTPLLLRTVGDYYAFFRINIIEQSSTLVDAIACIAFEDKHPEALRTLMNIALVEGISFLEGRVDNWYTQRRLWRPNLISFLGELIECAPVHSFNCLHVMIDFIVRALDPHNPNKRERSACVLSVAEMIRSAVNYLPNISFQQNLQFLAVGNNEGKIHVINLKTTCVVASFFSHTEPILCVAYSSDTLSHDIAVLGEKLDTLKIWRANRHTSMLSAIFTGPTLEFKLKHVIDIPSMEKCTSTVAKRDLLITTCKLRWLSPHCVELSSPWHDKIQLTVQ